MSGDSGDPLAVVKVGGEILLDAQQLDGLINNIRDLADAGWQCVVLHGGGAQVSALQALHKLPVRQVGGRRITSRADLLAVKQGLCGQVNVDLVAAMIGGGLPAFGCSGASGKLIQAVRRPPRVISGAGPEPVDFGEVGDVVAINVDLLLGLIQLQQVPVIASLGVGQQGELYNINADTTATQIASAVQAEALILTTTVGGILTDIEDPASRIATITPESAKQLIKDGVIADGMIPKVEEALQLLHRGIKHLAITSAAHKGSFLNVINNSTASGTRFVNN
ncbi:MAG: acetylglutamate kinase [Arenicella sp.]|nr:acetylglutamate kinase [Arenicella sp.]